MILVHWEDVQVPEDRQRKEFNERKMKELQDSIQRIGLLHPIVVEPNQDEDTWTLRAGERRLRAMLELHKEKVIFRCGDQQVPTDYIPVAEWSKLSDLERLEIEVAENVDRSDFTFPERVRALARLHELRQSQNPQHTISDTATEVHGREARGSEITNIAEALAIAKHLDDPDVAKAKDRKEALRAIKRKTDVLEHARLAKAADLTKSEHTLLQLDCLEWLKTCPANTFNVVLTDPPYGIDADDFGTQATTGHDYKDSRKSWEAMMLHLPDHLFRVTKPQAHAYLFCDHRLFERLSVLMVIAGWRVYPWPMIWFKGSNNGMLPFPKHAPRRTYECILYAWKGEKETLVVKPDCIDNIPAVRKELKHGAQKPVALYCDLLSRSARPGDAVLDCCGGSGTILVAANRMRLRATYLENNPEQFNIATSRVNVKDIDDGAEADDGLGIDFSSFNIQGAGGRQLEVGGKGTGVDASKA